MLASYMIFKVLELTTQGISQIGLMTYGISHESDHELGMWWTEKTRGQIQKLAIGAKLSLNSNRLKGRYERA